MQKRKSSTAASVSKFSASYWRDRVFRPTYTGSDGERREVTEWYMQCQHSGRRETLGLGTNNREEASRQAARLYQSIRAKGWDATLAKVRPSAEPLCPITIGDYIKTVQPVLKVRPRTLANYTYALRKIAVEIVGTSNRSKERFNPKSLSWREKADKLQMAKLTPESVERWKMGFVSRAGNNPVKVQRARHSANGYLANARALFSRRVLKRLNELSVQLPSPLPFEGVEMERRGSTRYISSIDAANLLQTARNELATDDPESWKVILLALGAGLRRSEIDALCWTQIDSDRSEVRILNHAHFEAKTEDSVGVVFIDAGLLSELENARNGDGLFVVEPGIEFQAQRKGQYYRCDETFDRVITWLRRNGVNADKPLHDLRKEFGSLICSSNDIYTASRQLRHSNISTTANFYLDRRNRATVPIGSMLDSGSKEAK